MTKEEAISIISGYEAYGCGYCLQGDDEVEEALRMAIDALRQETVIRCKDCEHRKGKGGCYEGKHIHLGMYMDANEYCGWAKRKAK